MYEYFHPSHLNTFLDDRRARLMPRRPTRMPLDEWNRLLGMQTER